MADLVQPQSVDDASGRQLVAWRIPLVGFRKVALWSITLTDQTIEFAGQKLQERIKFDRERAPSHLLFIGVKKDPHEAVLEIAKGIKRYKFLLPESDYQELFDWSPEKQATVLKQDIRLLSIGLFIVTILSFLLNRALNPWWMAGLLPLALAGIVMPRKPLFITDGISFITLGLLDCHFAYFSPNAPRYVRWIIPILWGSLKINDFFWYRNAR